MKAFLAAGIAAILLTGPAMAQSGLDACRKITGEVERLACYDKLPSAAPKAAAKAAGDEPMIAAAKAAALKMLREPSSAQFSGLTIRTAADGAKGVCGQVNARNAMGGMSGNKLMVYDGKMARIMVDSDGPGNPTDFDRLLIGVTLRETLAAYERFCK
jgi:hypothetical protein